MNFKLIEVQGIPWTDRSKFLWPAEDAKLHKFIGHAEHIEQIMEFVPDDRRRIVVQAGGACGIWPLRLSYLFETVFTFEPYPVMFQCLAQNCQGIDNIVMINAALAHKHAMVGMAHPPGREDNYGAQHITPTGRIPTLRIDDLALPCLDLLILDIEGAEFPAILGGMASILAYKPVVVFESKGHGALFGHAEGLIETVMEGCGYEVAKQIERDVVMVPA